ncbi:hypothetical protein DESC_770068 [Desulfosarcina cetonica]|nr:hypothetical protein DESC_770068 [Desulfosarcina cetonica]
MVSTQNGVIIDPIIVLIIVLVIVLVIVPVPMTKVNENHRF